MIKLNNGCEIPGFGLGTYGVSFNSDIQRKIHKKIITGNIFS